MPPMRPSAPEAVNAVAWAVLAALIGVALHMIVVLGPFGLILLGLLTLFVCTSMELREDSPTWSVGAFKPRADRLESPEQRAAAADERALARAPLPFYRWCGVVLLAAGVAGFVWQQLY